MAYDPRQRPLSPGKCLLLLRIDRWVKEDGVRILDFLAGDESYKRAYTSGRAYRVWSMRLMPPSLRPPCPASRVAIRPPFPRVRQEAPRP